MPSGSRNENGLVYTAQRESAAEKKPCCVPQRMHLEAVVLEVKCRGAGEGRVPRGVTCVWNLT